MQTLSVSSNLGQLDQSDSFLSSTEPNLKLEMYIIWMNERGLWFKLVMFCCFFFPITFHVISNSEIDIDHINDETSEVWQDWSYWISFKERMEKDKKFNKNNIRFYAASKLNISIVIQLPWVQHIIYNIHIMQNIKWRFQTDCTKTQISIHRSFV